MRVSNGLDPDQDRHRVGPDLGPIRLQRLSAADQKEGFNGGQKVLSPRGTVRIYSQTQ